MDALAQPTVMDETDAVRVRLYTLLAQILARPPSPYLLGTLAGLGGDESPLGQALGALGAAAAATGVEAAEREFNALFIGVDRGELVPYASYYLTGFLNDRPLARLRQDMAALGVERAPGVPEPEDHIAALCEVMAGLIGGGFGAPAGEDQQRRFFDRHMGPWAVRFFTDLEHASAAALYRPVGTLGRLFLTIETNGFAAPPADESP
ncbi:MAG TPA: molecular chaperone TorD family protein [Azospirillum sp.]|nr:molecular chaperone TorD family protein [Azospirillum sp.]